HPLLAERWLDVPAGVHLVRLAGRLLDLQRPEPLIYGDAQRRVRLGVPLGVHLREQPREDALGLLLVGRRLAAVQPLTGQRIGAVVYLPAQGVATALDRAAVTGPSLGASCHG